MNLRPELPGDQQSVHALHRICFPGPGEADLVGRLRLDGDAMISLVAVDGENILGHVMFSRVNAPLRALGLGPVAVLPISAGEDTQPP